MNKKLQFNGVVIKEEKDIRDYNIAMFIPGENIILNEEFKMNLPKLEIVLNQKQYSSCVGHSFAIAKSILEYQKTNKWIDIDPYAIYGTRYPGEYNGIGMNPCQGAKVLLLDGAFLRRDFGIEQEVPQIIGTLDRWKSNNMDKVAKARELAISAYYYVYDDNQVQISLKNGIPISATYEIYNSFYGVKEDGVVQLPTNNDIRLGYHQMTIVGWTKNNQWIVINSWGTNRGLKGMYLIPFSYRFKEAIAVCDTITPIKYKAKEISFCVNSESFIVDGECKTFDVTPYIKNNRTYVPIRFITEALGASVEWLENSRKVIIRSEEAYIEMQIDNPIMKVNNKEKRLDVCPEITNDRTMLPIRAIAEALNCKVDWFDGKVIINAL